MTVYKIGVVVIGRGGHYAHMIGDSKFSGTVEHPVKLSGYEKTIDAALADFERMNRSETRDFYEFTDDAVAIDLTKMSDDNIWTFSISGPMVNPFLPPNTVQGLGGTRQWDGGSGELTGNVGGTLIATSQAGITAIMTSGDSANAAETLTKNPEGSIFGNAGSLDDVSLDIYVKLAEAFGAEVRKI